MTYRNDPYRQPPMPPNIQRQVVEQYNEHIESKRDYTPIETVQPKSQHRKKPRPQSPPTADIFSQDFTNIIGEIAKFVSSVSTITLLLGLSISAAFLDVILGAFGLENIFNYAIPFGSVMIKTVWIAGAISVFTSGIQVYLMLMWTSKRKDRKMKRGEKLVMYGLMLLDTAVDMTVPGFLMYGETALTIKLVGKPFMYYVVTLLVGIACAFSENVIVSLRNLSDHEPFRGRKR